MNAQTVALEDLDRFRDMLRILAAGVISRTPAPAGIGTVNYEAGAFRRFG